MKTSRKIHGRPANIQEHRSDEYSAIVLKLHPPFFTQKGPGQPSRDPFNSRQDIPRVDSDSFPASTTPLLLRPFVYGVIP